MRVGSLFAGIGGFDLAAERAGMEVAWQSEIDPKASAVLDHHWPHIKNLGDIHGIRNPPNVDVLTGGFPCQDYSVAGLRGGLAGDRGALWWEYHRLITALRPTWVVGENVPGLLSSRGGADFETIVGSLLELGYGVAWAVLDAQYFGVAQRRRRVFIVGHSRGVPRPEVLAVGEGLFGHPEPRREAGERTAPTLAARTRGGGWPGTDEALDGAVISSLTASHSYDQVGNEGWLILGFNWQANSFAADLGAKSTHTDSLHAGQVPAVFAQNQRDEVGDLGDKAGALAAEPGMKQQTYVAKTAFTKSNGWGVLGDGTTHTVDSSGAAEAVISGASVRRLTPLECERLQGFPDGWTATPGNSDTQRYRQLGNAVAVPVVEWIMGNIQGVSDV